MNMTPAEILSDYNQAKQPLKQIGILADLNGCTKHEIAEILRKAGAKLPQQFDQARHNTKKKPEQEAVPEVLDLPELTQLNDASVAALNTIRAIVNSDVEETRALFQIEGVIKMFLEVAE